jgi:dTDP-4-dehydrorhamnose reductase
MNSILLTGADGQLGWELARTLGPLGEVPACARTHLDAYEPSRRPTLTPLTTEQYAATAQRPRNSSLANDKIRAKFGIVMPSWRDALALCADEARAFAVPRPGRRA